MDMASPSVERLLLARSSPYPCYLFKSPLQLLAPIILSNLSCWTQLFKNSNAVQEDFLKWFRRYIEELKAANDPCCTDDIELIFRWDRMANNDKEMLMHMSSMHRTWRGVLKKHNIADRIKANRSHQSMPYRKGRKSHYQLKDDFVS
ncbi:hypothetical protein Taro_041910 [Colocasia esculenta]|uniref:Uncharacterized protein n=1 Tax=Colocasia esculenta TaxID=4460 RepID=A0A843WH31_COLES|nr:hypothetical protein [Colocasia esculenta]